MGRKERLAEYWRKLKGMYHRADTASESGVYLDPAADRCEAAIQKYGVPNKIYVDTGISVQSTFQRVTRRGIKVNEKEYLDDDLIFRYLGRTVNVVVAPDVIRVEDMDKKVITTFTPIQN